MDAIPRNLRGGSQAGSLGYSLCSQNQKDTGVCLLAVKGHGGTLYYVPPKKRTKQICLIAVKHYGEAMRLVPEQHKTPELYIWTNRKRDTYNTMNSYIRDAKVVKSWVLKNMVKS